MKIEFSSKNYEISENLKSFTEKRINKLQKFFQDEDWLAKVLLRESKYIYESEISILHNGEWMKAKAKANEVEHSIIQTVDHLKIQLMKKLKKQKQKKRWEAHHGKSIEIVSPSIATERKFSRRDLSQIEIETLNESEALQKFDPEKKPFLLFKDLATDTLKLIYEDKNKKIILNLGVE